MEKITRGLPAMQKRALENQKRAPENCHRLQCKSLFNVADLVNGMWKVAPQTKNLIFGLTSDIVFIGRNLSSSSRYHARLLAPPPPPPSLSEFVALTLRGLSPPLKTCSHMPMFAIKETLPFYLSLYRVAHKKNGTAYFPQYVDARTSISVWGNFSWE